MNLKKEFEKKFAGISYDTDDIWGWIEKKLKEEYEKGDNDAIKLVKIPPYVDRIDYEIEVYRDHLIEKLRKLG